MEAVESCVPPGFRFHPTEEELVGYYLTRKVNSQTIDLGVINDIDLYRIEPWDLQDRCKLGYEEQSEWYFFSHKDKKYPTGTRTNRATAAGFWKATGRDKVVHSKHQIIGMRKTLVFYKGRAPNGRKTDWIMHEYRLQTIEHGPPQEEGWVVCRAFRKQSPNQRRSVDAWEPNYFLRDHQQLGSQTLADVVINSNIPAHVNNNISYNYNMAADPAVVALCHDDEGGYLSNKQQNQYFGQLLDLPQLESPSSLSNSFTSKEGMEPTTASINEEQGQCCRGTTTSTDHKAGTLMQYEEAQRVCTTTTTTTTDQWRTLENLMAPQLNVDDDGALSSTSTLPSINPHHLEYYEQVHVLNGGGTGFNMMSSFPAATYRS